MSKLFKLRNLRIFYANDWKQPESFILLHHTLIQNIKKASNFFSNAEKLRKTDDLINRIASISNELNSQEQRINNPILLYSK